MLDKLNSDHFLLNSGYSNYEDSTDLPRHRWFYYKEGFSPNLVSKAIDNVGVGKDEIILDPFNGSGTTTLTASMLGHKSVGVEVNPFTSFLSSAKEKNADNAIFRPIQEKLLAACSKGADSNLIGYSTFSYKKDLDKWLFNKNVLRAFEGGWKFASKIKDRDIQQILKLALITTAMDNCNAIKDGKCLRYRDTWKSYKYNNPSFCASLENKLSTIEKDVNEKPIGVRSRIISGDVRQILKTETEMEKFKLCITSPPYLNTFDYTDIYRPELFLGKFVRDTQELYELRLKTVRSHIQARWTLPTRSDFGLIYQQTMAHVLKNEEALMDKYIPVMIQAYFEDMTNILTLLKQKADKGAQVWLIVSNSAYADLEVPVDLIIGDIGSKNGWNLKEIGVLRKVQKRKTKHSPSITELRESLIIFENPNK